MQQALSPSALGVFGNLPMGFEVERAPSRTARLPEVQTGSDSLFLETLRANLHAAARHAALGHKESSFRQCSAPACVEAANMLPDLATTHSAATDAELDAAFDKVLATLEREGTPFLAPKPS